MLNPSIGKLLDSYSSRYQLVIDVSRRARKISRKVEEDKEIIIEKPVSLAIADLAETMSPNEDID